MISVIAALSNDSIVSSFPMILIGDETTTRFKGSNLRMPTGYTPYEWDNWYNNWYSIYNVWVKDVIDHLVDDLGCNVIRMIGDVQVVTRGVLSLEDYLTRYEEFIDYCYERQVYVYACGGDPNHMKQEDLSLAPLSEVIDVLVPWAAMCAGKYNVIGIEPFQEVNGWPDASGTIAMETEANIISNVASIYAAVKAVAGDKPVGFSFANLTNNSTYYTSSLPAAIIPDYSDFVDMHQYIWPWSPSTMTGAYSYGKPVIIGETGMSWTSSNKDDLFQVLADEQFDMPLYEGVLTWHAADNNPDTSDQWGFWSIDEEGGFTPYDSSHNDIFETIPTTAPEP